MEQLDIYLRARAIRAVSPFIQSSFEARELREATRD